MEIDSYHDVTDSILSLLTDGQLWTSVQLTDAIFPGHIHGSKEHKRRNAQIRRALDILGRDGKLDRENMWSPQQSFKHYGWKLAQGGEIDVQN